jgi:hypothetical protein
MINMMLGRFAPALFTWAVLTQLGSIDNAVPEAATPAMLFRNSLLVCLSISAPFQVSPMSCAILHKP